MTPNKLAKIRQQIASCRRKANTHRDLEGIATALKRKLFNRGKEPNYISTVFPDLRPVSIPCHAGKTIKTGTANSILDQLEEDVWRFEQKIKDELKKIKEGNGHYDEGEDADE